MERVVITGIGIHSCLGTSIEEVKESLFQGKSGIGIDPEREAFGYRSALTGMVPTPELKKILKRRDRIGLSQEAEYAYVSTLQAIEMAGLDMGFFEANEVGIIFGNDSSAKAVVESTDIIREKKDTTLVGSGAIFQSMNCTVNMNLATLFKLTGINYTISAACASGSHSVGMGYHMIKSGMQDMIICGGAQEVNKYAFGSFDGLGTFSTNVEDPTKASRPFDQARDGLVPSGGAATLILESLTSAQKRGATILAEVVGYGFSSNGTHLSNPDMAGQVKSIDKAFKDAQISPEDVDYVNAHATSTPAGDAEEAKALAHFFAGLKTPISSTKSLTGHECWMAGASELVYSIIMMQNNFAAPNINLEEKVVEANELNIINCTFEQNIDVVLSNSFGFGGTNSTIILKKWQ